MRKEVLIAIILGFALGLIITFGVWSANKAMREKETAKLAEEPTPPAQTTPTVNPTFSLVILSPEDESLQSQEKIILSGTTEPEAIVMIIGEVGEIITEADDKGQFASEIKLENGTNEITITATNTEGEEANKTLHLVYSTTEI